MAQLAQILVHLVGKKTTNIFKKIPSHRLYFYLHDHSIWTSHTKVIANLICHAIKASFRKNKL